MITISKLQKFSIIFGKNRYSYQFGYAYLYGNNLPSIHSIPFNSIQLHFSSTWLQLAPVGPSWLQLAPVGSSWGCAYSNIIQKWLVQFQNSKNFGKKHYTYEFGNTYQFGYTYLFEIRVPSIQINSNQLQSTPINSIQLQLAPV